MASCHSSSSRSNFRLVKAKQHKTWCYLQAYNARWTDQEMGKSTGHHGDTACTVREQRRVSSLVVEFCSASFFVHCLVII
ncbi:hypothetical protein GOP47_0009466 [Adiantum capillus-veneris]|uniref:Uncharacterized protein n=1 Tax=Adiantum capillus-veneris TaxID=13818 RepID=A0A9D4UW93_ADICA|nr:hypothetical protein GOP47_0009466 [Adiantum capillus-veneris]